MPAIRGPFSSDRVSPAPLLATPVNRDPRAQRDSEGCSTIWTRITGHGRTHAFTVRARGGRCGHARGVRRSPGAAAAPESDDRSPRAEEADLRPLRADGRA